MKKFGQYVLSLLATIAILLILLDCLYTYTYLHGTPRNKISHLLSINNKKIDYVFIGSSRVDNTIDPEIIEKETGKTAINLGVQGGKIDDYLLILKLVKKQNIKTKVIFIQIDYVYNMDGNSEILKSSLMPYIGDEFVSNYLKQRNSDYLFLKYFPFYRYLKYDYKLGFREFISTSIGKEPKMDFNSGYFPKKGNNGKKMKAKLPNKLKINNKKIDEINSFAEENNLQIVYFFSPYCAEAINLDFSKKLEMRFEKFLNFSQKLPDNKDYFFDCAHLNDNGAKAFSSLFAREIRKLQNQ